MKTILCARWGTSDGSVFVADADRLPRLLERAAVIAAREDSPASEGIRKALEALKREGGK